MDVNFEHTDKSGKTSTPATAQTGEGRNVSQLNASDFESITHNVEKDNTLLKMLRAMKHRNQESNNSPKRNFVQNSSPSFMRRLFGDNPTYSPSSMPSASLEMENNALLKTVLMEVRQNGSSIDCLFQRWTKKDSN